MRTRRTQRTLLALTATALVTLGLAGCSGGDSVEAFCNAGNDMEASSADVDPSDMAGSADALDEAVASIEDVDAPDEIADDVETVLTSMKALSTSLRELDGLDPSSDDYLEKASALGSTVDSDDFEAASTNVSDFVAENCK